MSRLPVWPVATVTLLLAFALAQGTGVRALGGAVLLAGGAWCAWRAVRRVGWGAAAAVLLVAVAAFVLSHVAADALGPWTAVLLAAAVLGATTWAVVDRPRARAAVVRRR
ncbi:hypothetical protein [Cellulomonas shaoxiangyii]|uniref:Uncharacterized protein n=1 Tax=Cellulomonas shaoxiangyii TaxID=2566013 RepID=A0A4P7SKV1_9CELL|nr:hypothetical protein [Cellulomonas shaoxiangyii]QCB94107.1 hypothetical protein E5225_11570 [Cellulomonas shaoxiangyii]TGY77735.1 hypothetical protein E5226_16885 [Cellulomonas shaoxiangyii]